MRTIVAGSRSITDYNTVLEAMYKSGFIFTEVVSGTARGVDKLGELIALDFGIPIVRFIPNWDKYGRAAGHIRNAEMAEYADALVAVWDGYSAGTKSMINIANKLNLAVYIEMV